MGRIREHFACASCGCVDCECRTYPDEPCSACRQWSEAVAALWSAEVAIRRCAEAADQAQRTALVTLSSDLAACALVANAVDYQPESCTCGEVAHGR